jgi:branched-chain amino acid transport system substrate-binding protein
VTKLIYEDDVWVVAGAPDGASAHLVEQVAAKARVVFVSTASTDATVNRANVPWVFSCTPGDHTWLPVLAEAVACKHVTLFASTDHDSRAAAAELSPAGVLPTQRIDLAPGRQDLAGHVRVLQNNGSKVVMILAGPLDGARVVRVVDGLDVQIVGGPAMGRNAFITEAGDAAEGVMFPLLWDRDGDSAASDFAVRFERKFGQKPDYTAAYTYDGMSVLIQAIRLAGLNRASIRDAIRGLSGWRGVTGVIRWDPSGQNQQTVSLGVVRGGQPVPMKR